ncbi:uncharacterized protein LOC143335539 [Chaetodon auriga]|uniref:uncharacterized protein LOC143335539 n=1 Tax=Chaetodon auriga TaxID=39042 RepID=UPI004032CE29
MYLDSDLRIEIISSLLGQTIKPYDRKRRGRTEDILSVDEFHLHNLIGKRKAVKESFIKEEDFFDPEYDCDFTNLSDTAECSRGDELYERPKGWYRMALKVNGKYADGDTWLGSKRWRSHSVPGEWPVSYHGTSLNGVKGIIRSHYSAGDRAMYGRGIYSTPDIHVAEREEYAKTFTSKTTGKSYKVILQNRINPKNREICKRFDYWLIRVSDGTSASEERKIVESSIRPYGILIKEVNDEGGGDVPGIYSGYEDDGGDDGDDSDSDDDGKYDDGSYNDDDDGDDNSIDDHDDDDDDDDDGGKYDDASADDISDNDDDDDGENGYGDGDDDESDDDGNVDDADNIEDDDGTDGYDDDAVKYDSNNVDDICDDDDDENDDDEDYNDNGEDDENQEYDDDNNDNDGEYDDDGNVDDICDDDGADGYNDDDNVDDICDDDGADGYNDDDNDYDDNYDNAYGDNYDNAYGDNYDNAYDDDYGDDYDD